MITMAALLLSAAVHGAAIYGAARFGSADVKQQETETAAAAAVERAKYAMLPDVEIISGRRASPKPDAAEEEALEKKEPFGTAKQESAAFEAERAANESFLYRDGVKRAIQQARFYPPQARKEGLEGPAGVEFTILKDGSVENVALFSSSGSGVLDREAMDTISRAAPYPRFTALMKDDKITMQVFIVFKLN